MSHSVLGPEVVFKCDHCPAVFRCGQTTIKGTWAEAEKAGWTTLMDYVKSISRFKHLCPNCRRE